MKHFDIINMRYCRQWWVGFCFFFCQFTKVSEILTFLPGRGILSPHVSFGDEKTFIAHF